MELNRWAFPALFAAKKIDYDFCDLFDNSG